MNDHLRAKLCEWANYTASPMPHEAQKVCAEAATELETLRAALAASEARVKWLEGLFDFSDPEIALHHAPNDPVTKDAVVVRLAEYEARQAREKELERGLRILIGRADAHSLP